LGLRQRPFRAAPPRRDLRARGARAAAPSVRAGPWVRAALWVRAGLWPEEALAVHRALGAPVPEVRPEGGESARPVPVEWRAVAERRAVEPGAAERVSVARPGAAEPGPVARPAGPEAGAAERPEAQARWEPAAREALQAVHRCVRGRAVPGTARTRGVA
jgi:hypothetical protein